ncbi:MULTISPECIES: tellurite resistance TerB family protein [unclassified Vibrio]|uniref:tellurite resistance TerB family protein n=1 Tax=unclassified Vibrio TaxID=2614977 RepID=UPI0013615EBB|nr:MULTISPECIES: TerB family tellurite resistance protein [unclassified Vibrio]NAW57148.1 hypothetical protein [Vibrio sp. V36_P2S2PM302]NAX24557.1 hypothetical protein [Vibrio sp. V38_P2S17PM301]NAX30332.1 hypothetical protein [Vibrio sp. V37_P2S8PM304]
MFNSIASAFKQFLEGGDLSNAQTANPNLAIACLLCEVADADHQVDDSERNAKLALLSRLTQQSEADASALLTEAEHRVQHSASLYDFTDQLRDMSQAQRFELVKAMWEVAHADGEIDPLEDALIRKTAELLYVNHSEFIRAKLAVTEKNQNQ